MIFGVSEFGFNKTMNINIRDKSFVKKEEAYERKAF